MTKSNPIQYPEVFEDFQISEDDVGKHATSPLWTVTVLPDGESRIAHRRCIEKNMKTGRTEKRSVLYAELDGVRVYIRGFHVVITKQKLHA